MLNSSRGLTSNFLFLKKKNRLTVSFRIVKYKIIFQTKWLPIACIVLDNLFYTNRTKRFFFAFDFVFWVLVCERRGDGKGEREDGRRERARQIKIERERATERDREREKEREIELKKQKRDKEFLRV